MKSEVPGPGSYQPKDIRKELLFTLKSRMVDHSLDESIKVPGPGAYNEVGMSVAGKYPTSKYANPRCCPVMRNSSRVRTEESSSVPGPNKCTDRPTQTCRWSSTARRRSR